MLKSKGTDKWGDTYEFHTPNFHTTIFNNYSGYILNVNKWFCTILHLDYGKQHRWFTGKYYKSAIISIALNNQFGNFYVLSFWSLCSYMGLPLSDGTMMLPLTLKCQKTKNCFHTMLQMPVSYMRILCHVCTVVFGCDNMQPFHSLRSDRKFSHLQKNKANILRLWHFVNIAQNFLRIHLWSNGYPAFEGQRWVCLACHPKDI